MIAGKNDRRKCGTHPLKSVPVNVLTKVFVRIHIGHISANNSTTVDRHKRFRLSLLITVVLMVLSCQRGERLSPGKDANKMLYLAWFTILVMKPFSVMSLSQLCEITTIFILCSFLDVPG